MAQPVFNYRYRKVGGIRFLRIGRFQFSFCLCRGTREVTVAERRAERQITRGIQRIVVCEFPSID